MMIDNPALYRRLSPGLQQRLAQLALLQQRAAVLARLPALTLTKGKPVRWAATPAPLLLRQVMTLAACDDQPRLSALLLCNWFQHKRELRDQVSRALHQRNYVLQPLGVLPAPAESLLPLAPKDRGPAPAATFFYPNGAPVPAPHASPEEITLMAELLGWSVRRPAAAEVGAAPACVEDLRLAYQTVELFDELLANVRATAALQSDAASLAAQGTLPATLDAAATLALANWPQTYEDMGAMWRSLHVLADQPAPDPALPVTSEGLEALVLHLEASTRITLFIGEAHVNMRAALAQVQRVRHRQHSNFAPLAAVHEQARELAARITPALVGQAMRDLWQQARPLMALLDWIDAPERLDQLDPQAPDLLAFEAAAPPAVLNALLLRKLAIAAEEAPGPPETAARPDQ